MFVSYTLLKLIPYKQHVGIFNKMIYYKITIHSYAF